VVDRYTFTMDVGPIEFWGKGNPVPFPLKKFVILNKKVFDPKS
jgi:hypothetical protein